MNYRTYLVALAAAVAYNAAAFGNFATVSDDKAAEPADTTSFVFTDFALVPTTSVKDQNKSGTCWCFAGTSMFEDEIVRRGGKPLDLSEMFTVRQCYLDKADRYVRMYGGTNFAAGGSIMDLPYVWKNYGAVPEEVYSGLGYGEEKHVHGELDAVLKAYLDAVIRKPNKRLSTAWRKGVEKYKIPWINVYNPENSTLLSEYGVQGFPTKIIISPQGKIANITVGEDPNFFNTLGILINE